MPLLSTLPINAGFVAGLTGPDWLVRGRLAAWERFAGRELPTESEEIWRYSRIDDLDLAKYAPAPLGAEMETGDLPPSVQDLVRAVGPDASLVISHNGGPGRLQRPQPGLTVEHAPGPLWGGQPAIDEGLGGPPAEVWADLNAALVGVPWRVSVAPGQVLRAPVVVVHWSDGDGVMTLPRLEVEMGEGASADVVEVVASGDGELLAIPVTELAIGAGARLGFGHVQLLGSRSWQLGNQLSRVQRDGRLVSMTLALGGDYARVRTGSVLLGPGAESQLLAGYFGAGNQVHDLRTVQHHAAPQCRSDLLFKGAVANEAQSVYSGLIRVEKGAKGTNAFQTNRNLVLSEGARAYSVPNLEIEDNDVRCSHASAVGPVDESQLFYLESRGIPSHVAERLVALGFLDDVLERFPVASVLGWSRQQMAAKLGAAGFADDETVSAHHADEAGGAERAGR